MSHSSRVLLIGTADTKSDELSYLRQQIESAGGTVVLMDVSVLGEAHCQVDIDKHQVFRAGGCTLKELIAFDDENHSMTLVAKGAARLALELQQSNKIDGVLIIGGTMGTDLALDVAHALPIGFPKFIVSTIAFSHLIPPDRLTPDLIMMLWSGGLYGLNSICKSALSQIAGAVNGACRTAQAPTSRQPKVGMTSFGLSAAKWMKNLVPQLEKLGYETIVFHATGMGGRAFEAMARDGQFVAVMDFATQEVANHHFDSPVSAGADRLNGAEAAGIPQLVAPGFIDLVDLPAWQALPASLSGQEKHDHNRLITSVALDGQQRAAVIKAMAEKLNAHRAATVVLLPTHGVHEWDRPGAALHDQPAIDAMCQAARDYFKPPVELIELDCHINDPQFCQQAMAIFEQWHNSGLLKR